MTVKPHTYPDISINAPLRLADFIRENTDQIISEWSNFARTLMPAGTEITPLALTDHISALLVFIADDLESPQTSGDQIKKSHGHDQKEGKIKCGAAEKHAALRLAGGFDLDQMISEYRALRASIVKLWGLKQVHQENTNLEDLIRFNEAVDQAITESTSYYTKKIDYSRNMFLGILGHDLRNPIGAASMCAQLLIKMGALDVKQTALVSQVIDSNSRATQIINDLLDLARTGFGSDLTVIKRPMDMGAVSKQMVDEMQACYGGREIILTITGNMRGNWDRARIEQVFSNLIGNAIQYSFKDTPVHVSVKGETEEITLSVHNKGFPIPYHKVGRIFDALTRETENQDSGDVEEQIESTNLGLGLYITKKIVTAHGGSVGVTSTEKEGTEFTARLPRHYY